MFAIANVLQIGNTIFTSRKLLRADCVYINFVRFYFKSLKHLFINSTSYKLRVLEYDTAYFDRHVPLPSEENCIYIPKMEATDLSEKLFTKYRGIRFLKILTVWKITSHITE
jgi:hypothetical protein